MSEVQYKSACLCGAVQLEITGEPAAMACCHCDSCRRWFGAPIHGGCLYSIDKVRIVKGEDRIGTFKYTEDSESHRKYCTSCSGRVMVDHPSINMTDIPAVSIQGLTFVPTLHSHYAERVLRIFDGLPKYKDFDPDVGGTGELLEE